MLKCGRDSRKKAKTTELKERSNIEVLGCVASSISCLSAVAPEATFFGMAAVSEIWINFMPQKFIYLSNLS
jgi:hypothetical protein